MKPEQAAKILGQVGALLLALLLVFRCLSIAETTQMPGIIPPTEEARLVTDQYSFSADGKRVIFHQVLDPAPKADRFKPTPAWFSMSIEGGPITVAEKPVEDIRPFNLRNDKLFLYVGDGSSLATGSLPNTKVRLTALSPNHNDMAFSAEQENGQIRLYILPKLDPLIWLGEETSISDISWSPDSQRIAYIAPRDGIDQVITIDRSGQDLRQVTHDVSPKRATAWLADSKTIVFIAQDQAEGSAPQPENYTESIYRANIEEPTPTLISGGLSPINSLNAVNGNSEIAFTQPIPDQKRNLQLFLLDPQTQTQRRAYPTISLDQLNCPSQLTTSKPGSIGLTLTNTGHIPASVPVILRSGTTPPLILGDREQGAQRIEAVDVSAGETRSTDWPLKPVPGLFTYVSVLVNLGEIYPMAEQHCSIPNKYLFLPNLSFLPFTLPLLIPGMLLALPWLRHRKNRFWWMLWLSFPIIIFVMIGIEAGMVIG